METLSPTHVLNIRTDFTEEDKKLIEKAVNFAILKHKGQTRKNGEPYVNHVIETGKILTELDLEIVTIVSGILHDILEDTESTEEEFEKEFGSEILFLVKGVSKLGKLKYHGVERHVESLRKFFVAAAEDIRVVLIKLADRLHNIRTLQYVNEEKRKRIALETLEIHARLADRIGMGQLKTELEDLAFPYAYPAEFKEINELIVSEKMPNEERLDEIKQNVELLLEVNDIKLVKMEHRLKHPYSLFIKLKRYNKDISKIHDVVALRIIVSSVSDCYKVLGLIHGEYRPMPGRIKDYIAQPKLNGYKSLHTTIFTKDGNTAEIQIRTHEMHKDAEYGIASHLNYKETAKKKNSEELKKKTAWTKELLEWQKNVEDNEEYLEHLKTDFFENRVFVFTPKGDVIDLPEGSSTIDFAYRIHTDIGNTLSSAKVNNKLVSIDTILLRGDIVEIIANKKSHPSKKWLENTKTTHAKKQIQKYLDDNKWKLFK